MMVNTAKFKSGDISIYCLTDPALELQREPWASESFDCMLVIGSSDPDSAELALIISALVKSSVDWVEVLGRHSERVHDAIDVASVSIGRQPTVGAGSPMTSWDEKTTAALDIAVHVFGGGIGCQDRKSLIFFCELPLKNEVLKCLDVLATAQQAPRQDS